MNVSENSSQTPFGGGGGAAGKQSIAPANAPTTRPPNSPVYTVTVHRTPSGEGWVVTIPEFNMEVNVPSGNAPTRHSRATFERVARTAITTRLEQHAQREPNSGHPLPSFDVAVSVTEKGTLAVKGSAVTRMRAEAVAGAVWSGRRGERPRSIAWCGGVFAGDDELVRVAKRLCDERRQVRVGGLHAWDILVCDASTPLGAAAAILSTNSQILLRKAPDDVLNVLRPLFA